jgi:hypothetical protein
MITCKEDLIGTYVDGRDIKLGNEYQKLLFKFGVKWLHFDDQEVRTASGMTNHFCFNGEFLSWSRKEPADINYEKKLTLKDLKPKPTKFVKVEESIFGLKEEFESGELYRVYVHHGDNPMYGVIDSEFSLIQAADRSNVYRQVETTERDLFIDMIEQAGAELSSDGEWSFACLAASVFDSGRIKLTGKPE